MLDSTDAVITPLMLLTGTQVSSLCCGRAVLCGGEKHLPGPVQLPPCSTLRKGACACCESDTEGHRSPGHHSSDYEVMKS